ncbi:MAG: universal stress protein [Bacteroidia bacterium]|nr:universal stress protein [Bacteroidia bacterium]
MKKLLVPTDFSPVAQNAYQYALKLARRVDGEVILLHVFDDAGMGELLTLPDLTEFAIAAKTRETERALKAFRQYEGQLREQLGMQEVPVSHVLLFGNPIATIVRYGNEREVDMIVMGTAGENNPVRRVLGTQTEHVLAHAKRPVLAVPQDVEF